VERTVDNDVALRPNDELASDERGEHTSDLNVERVVVQVTGHLDNSADDHVAEPTVPESESSTSTACRRDCV